MADQLTKLPEGTQLTVGSHNVTIVKYLSEGGFAHIYQVLIDPKEYDSDIACLKRVIVPDKAGLDQLRKEVDVMKKLKHARSIVRYYDSHAERLESGSYQVLVLMELCPNKSLLDFMNAKIKTKLSEGEILKIMFDISLGIFEMHKTKMIHRDIKIENVLIDSNHRFKLCDFGSTSVPIPPPKNQQEFQVLSHDIMFQTTPQYRSPEMIDLYRGFPIDEKADIWALGCFLYKLCYYTTPFEANGDIAILHASFQFPSHPQYSGDLKNLIIILLQENPIFRPNIVQVIKLVSKMLKVDFQTLDVKDIYKAGSYNFQALHDYQQQRQNEMLRQQQIYFQQQQQQQQQQYTQAQVVQQIQDTPISTSKSSASLDVDGKSTKSEPEILMPDGVQDNAESDSSFGELEDLDNVEERYPSLENIVADSETSKSAAASVKSNVTTGPTPNTYASQETKSYVSSPQNQNQPAVSNMMPITQYPIQPPVLPPQELQKLSAEQLQQYNYLHQAYHYQMNQWIYYQQQQKQAYYNQQMNPQTRLEKSSSSNQVNDLKNKEAWEINESKVDGDAGKLADDIFGSKSRSPTEVHKAQPAQKTSQSVKSEPAYDDKDNDKEDWFENENIGKNIRLTKSNNSSEANLLGKSVENNKAVDENVIENQTKGHGESYEEYEQQEPNEGNEDKVPHKDKQYALPNKEKEHKEVDDFASSDLELLNSDFIKEEPKSARPQLQSTSSQPGSIERPKTLTDSKKLETAFLSSPLVPVTSKNHNPFPRNNPPPHESNAGLLEQSSTSPDAIRKSSSNPWGEYRTTSSSSNVPPLEQLHKKMNTLSISDNVSRSRSTSRKPSHEEPNLIDLEVGLDSSSSVSTPVFKASDTVTGEPDSLIDLELEGKFNRHQSDRPHFKNRTSAIINPSDFKVEEEVIDWASDDESPANSSKMNRLSIRNSLKQGRKSSEHKRSESTTGETNKKRLSRLMSNG